MDNIIIQKMLVMDNTVVVTEPFSPKGPIRGRNGSHNTEKGDHRRNGEVLSPPKVWGSVSHRSRQGPKPGRNDEGAYSHSPAGATAR